MTTPDERDLAKLRRRSTRNRFVLAFLGLALGLAAVAVTFQERHAVAHRQVESYSTLPVLMLQLAGVFALIAIVRLALGNPRHPRTAAACLLVFLVCIAATRALWDTSLPHDPPPDPAFQTPPPTTMANIARIGN